MNCYESKIKNVKSILLFFFLIGIIYFLRTILLNYPNGNIYFKIKYMTFQFVGWSGTLLCGYLSFYYILKLFKPGPAVIVNEKGIIDYRSIYGLIPWADIKSLNFSKTDESEILEINIPNSKVYLKRSGLMYCLNSFSLDFYIDSSKITIIFNDMEPDLDKVWEYIQKNHANKIVVSG